LPTLNCQCPTCGKVTPHRTSGAHERQREPDGRDSQSMECAICKTATRVYFSKGTNEFQENLDTPHDSNA